MLAKRRKITSLSNRPQALFYDTSILVAQFNLNKSEDHIAQKSIAFADEYTDAARFTVFPCLVELIHHSRKKMSPFDIRRNLDALRVSIFPNDDESQKIYLSEYWEGTVKNRYDLADYILCRTALQFPISYVLTMDTRDLPLAMGDAYMRGSVKFFYEFKVFS